MAIRADVGAAAQPLRLMFYPAALAFLATAAAWLRTRSTDQVTVSPVSHDWLMDLQRQSTRTRDL
jgi:hypothetical protein